ncbi:MAG TPA: magnesium transporter [Gemmataceae bacterium]|nr:magnesium transporter [Gemmataceae bacterium]
MKDAIKPDPTIKRHLDDPITRHMRRDFSRLLVSQTVGEALEAIRRQPPEGRVIYFFVVDAENRLHGVVPTRRLLLNPLDKKVADIMVSDVITIGLEATVLDACEFFTLHRLLAFPVVDEERRIVGVVDVEMYTTELSDLDRSARNDYLFQLAGIHLTEAQQSAPLIAFRSRFPWLLCNIAGGILAAFLSGVFEDELQKAVALALFIPVVLALAESVSIQSVSLALRVLQGQSASWASILAKLRAEAMIGVLLGVASGMSVAVVAGIWLGQVSVVLCTLGAIAGGVASAAVIGMAIPNLLHRLALDPQIAAGPIALAAADMVTLLIYFNLARWLLA